MGWLVDEWPYLCQELIPRLGPSARTGLFSAAVCGSPREAASLALALSSVSGEEGDFEVFLCPGPAAASAPVPAPVPADPDPVGFAPVEMIRLARQVGTGPDRDGHRGVPSRKILERVLVGAPDRPVDLVIVEGGPSRACLTGVLDRLRTGGRVFTQDRTTAARLDPAQFRPLDARGRLAERVTGPGDAGPPSSGGRSRPTLAQIVAQAEMVKSNYALARGMARRYCRVDHELPDLEQVAFAALVGAAGRYDPGQHTAFTSYAARCVSGEIKRYFRDRTRALRSPHSLQEAYLQVRVARDELAQRLGSSPSVDQIAERLATTEETVLAAMEAGAADRAVPLDSPVREDPGPGPCGPFDLRLDPHALAAALPALEERQRLIVRRILLDGRTQAEVATELGVSQVQLARRVARALVSLRQALAGRCL